MSQARVWVVTCLLVAVSLSATTVVPSSLSPSSNVVNASLVQGSNASAPVVGRNVSSLAIDVKKIYFINLDERFERREFIESQLKGMNLTYSRKSAIRVESLFEARSHAALRAKLLNTSIDPILSFDNEGFVTSVYLSHVTLYEEILREWNRTIGPNDAVLVLEDDAIIAPNWKERLEALSPSVPSDWQILRIGHWGELRKDDMVNEDVVRARQPFFEEDGDVHHVWYGGAHAVLLRLSTLEATIKGIASIPLIDIDSVLTHCCDRLKSYVLAETLVDVNYNFDSDNQARVPLPV